MVAIGVSLRAFSGATVAAAYGQGKGKAMEAVDVGVIWRAIAR
jgi:hypothetical protein